MTLQSLQNVYKFYKGANTPSTKTYPARLPRMLSSKDLRSYRSGIIDASEELTRPQISIAYSSPLTDARYRDSTIRVGCHRAPPASE
jgi:hypothetical protein